MLCYPACRGAEATIPAPALWHSGAVFPPRHCSLPDGAPQLHQSLCSEVHTAERWFLIISHLLAIGKGSKFSLWPQEDAKSEPMASVCHHHSCKHLSSKLSYQS